MGDFVETGCKRIEECARASCTDLVLDCESTEPSDEGSRVDGRG